MRRIMVAILLFISLNKLIMAAPCGSPGTMLFYLNGMFNSPKDANDGRIKLNELVSGKLDKITTQLLHNQVSYKGNSEKWKLWTIEVTQNQNGGLAVKETWAPEFLGDEQ